MIRVALVDHPGSGCKDDLGAIAAALTIQVAVDFNLYYNIGATFRATQEPDPDEWIIGMFADADQPGALGYHDLSPVGLPFAKVFPILDAQDGAHLSTTISHEALEMISDPFVRRAIQGTDGKFWAEEPGDAVEQDEYQINGVWVSNFVLPAWYYGGAGRFDLLGLCKSPLEVRPGGYAQWFDTSKGWQQTINGEMRPYRKALQGTGRAGRRLK